MNLKNKNKNNTGSDISHVLTTISINFYGIEFSLRVFISNTLDG